MGIRNRIFPVRDTGNDQQFQGQSDSLPLSSYMSAMNTSPLETLEVHEQGVSRVHQGGTRERSVVFSKRKAAFVSAIITVVVTLVTGVSIVSLSRQAHKDDGVPQRLALDTQDIDIKNPVVATKPAELQGESASLLVNGELITRGGIKVTSDAYVAVLRPAALTAERQITIPDASGALCLSSNNCSYATTAQVQALQSRVGQIAIPAIPPATLVNGLGGAVGIQGASNQISVTTANGIIALAAPQDLAPISSPTFANMLLTGNFSITGTVTLPLNCSTNLNGGALTTNASGQIICSDDDVTAGGSAGVTSPGGTAGVLAVFTGADTIADSIISQLVGAVAIGGNASISGTLSAASLTLASALSVPNGGTGSTSFISNGVVYGNGTGALATTVAPSVGQVLVGSLGGAPQFVSLSGDVAITGAGVATIAADSVNLATDTVGNYVASLGVLAGLTVSGNSGEGSSPALSVVYGSTINTAVQGDTTITISAGTNLTGGGSITLGAGGSLSLDVTASPVFTGNVVAQGGSVMLGSLTQAGLTIIHDGNGQTGSLSVTDLTSNRTYTLPDASGIVCISTGNCAGAGGGVTTAGGTTDRISKFSGGQTLTDSSITDNGSVVAITGTANLVVQGGNATLGTLSQAGSLAISDGSAHYVSIIGSGFTGNRNYTLPDAGSDATFCLNTGNCVGGANGAAPNGAAYLLAALDGTLANERALVAGNNISINDGGANGNFTVATIQNPSFSTSVTSPLLQSSGALTFTSAAGNIIAVDAGSTIELQDSTNVTGNFAATGTVAFSGYNCTTFANGGVLTTNASGQLVCADDDGGAGSAITGSGTNGSVALFSGSQSITNSIITQSGTTIAIAGDLNLGSALTVANGGTGAANFTTNGVIYGNGSGTLQASVAGTPGQVLVASASGVPTFVSFSGDVSVSSMGITTIQPNSVALGSDTTGNYIATIGTLIGLSTTGNTGEGSTPTLSVVYGNSANTAVQGSTTLSCATGVGNLTGGGTVITLGTGGACADIATVNNPTFSTSVTTPSLIMTGAGSQGTMQVAALGQATTYTLPDPGQATATLCVSTGNCASSGGGVTTSGGAANRVVKFTNSQIVGDSSLSDDGVNVVVNGTTNLVVQGGNATLGTLTQAGILSISDGSSNTVSLITSGFAANRNYTLPDVGSDAVFCMSTGNCIGGSGGSPNAAAYLVATLDGTLSNERAVAAGSNISITDGGANSNFTVATVQNPTFTTSVTTPLLQSSGALTITSANGTVVAIDAGTTIELQDSTNVTGGLDVSGGITSGTSNAFQVNSAGAVSAAAGITSSGTIIFSSLNCTANANSGKLTTNASGQVMCADDVATTSGTITGTGSNGTIPLFNSAQTLTNSIVTQSGTTVTIAGDLTLTTALAVSEGGTGQTSFTTNGIVYGNGSGSLQVTAAGTSGQVLVANASGIPAFVSFSGDVAVTSAGITTIQANSVALGTDTTGNYVSVLGTLTGLSTTGNAGEGSTPTLSILYGSSANTAVQGNTSVTCPSGTGNLSGGGTSIVLGTGGACNDIDTVANPTFVTSVTTPIIQSSGALALTSAAGSAVSINAATTIELQDSTNITGDLDVSGGFTSGTSDAFQISAGGAISSATGLTTSGAVTLSAFNCTANANGGKLTTNASGLIMCADDIATTSSAITGTGSNGSIPLFNGAQTLTDSIITQSGTTISIAGDLALGSALAVAQGGTGRTSVTTNGVLYGNGSSSLQVTSAGTGGQVLVANASGVPTFMSLSGDVSVSNSGGVTISSGAVTSAKISDGTITNVDIASGSFTNITSVGVLTSLQNDGSTLFGAYTIADLPSGGSIGTAASTVDAHTNFAIAQTTPGQSITVPAPTNTASGRVALISNSGSTAFLLNGIVLLPGSAVMGYWNGSSWTSVGLDGGATAVGIIDTQAKSSNGAAIVGSNLYLQTADATYPGLISTGAQSLAGAKTFTGQIIGQSGLGVTGGVANLNVNSNFNTNINAGTSTGAVNIGNASSGAIGITSGANLDLFATAAASLYANTSVTLDTTTGAINIATNGTAQTVNIGAPATGAITIQNGSTLGITSTTTVTGRSTGDALTVSNDSSTGNILVLKDSNTAVATFADGGAVTLQNTTNSTGALRVLNQAGTSTVLSVDSTNVRVGVGTAAPNATLHVSGNQSSSAWGVSGIGVRVSSATYTDTTSASGTVAFASANSFGTPTINASNTGITYTSAATLYVANAPQAGTNVTITNPYALYVANGATLLNGAVTSTGGFTATSGTGFTATSAAANAISLQATTPTAANNSSMVRLGNSIVSGSANGTFLGINAASSFTGDYLNFQTNSTSALRVSAAGDTTVGGTLNVSSTTTLSGNLIVNTNNFFVNTSNGRVGINNAAPNNRFSINTPYNTTNLGNVDAVITASSSSTVPLVIQVAGTPTANAFQVQGSNGTILSGFQAGGGLFVAAGAGLGSTALSVSTGTDTNIGLQIRNVLGQSANMISLTDYNGLTHMTINPTGNQLTLGRIAASGVVSQGKIILSDGTTSNLGLTLQSATLSSSDKTVTFPNATGTVCLDTGNCSGSGAYITNGTSLQAGANFNIGGSGTASTFTANDSIAIPSATSTTSSNYRLSVQGTILSANDSQYGLQNQVIFDPTDAGNNIWGMVNSPQIGPTNDQAIANFIGAQTSVQTNTGYAGLVSTGTAMNVGGPTINGTQKITTYHGVRINNNDDNGGNTSGVLTNYQLRVGTITAAAGTGGTVNNYGVHVTVPAAAGTGTTNNYGLYLAGNGGSGAGTTSYSLYNASTALSYFAGPLTTAGVATFRSQTDSTASFEIQNSTGTALLSADTTNMRITVSALVVSNNITVNGHIITGGSAPTITAGAAACTSPTVSVSGTDTAGMVTVTTGTGCGGVGKMATVTFNSAFGAAPRITLTPSDANAAQLRYYVDNSTVSTASFDLGVASGSTIGNATTYRWYYHVIQ